MLADETRNGSGAGGAGDAGKAEGSVAHTELAAGKRKPAVRFIFLTLLLDVLGIGLIIPVAPRLIDSLVEGGEDKAAPWVGWLTATYALMMFVFAPVLGALSDRFGRRPVILISLFGSGLDYFAMALSPNLWFLFVTRALNGISGANISACNAYVADVTPPEKRAAGFGMVGAAFGLGFVIGPVIGGKLGDIDIHYPFYAAGTLCLINWLYGYFVLPESLPRERRRAFSIRRANPFAVMTHLGRYPLVMGLASAIFFLNLAMFGLHATWTLYTQHRYGWSFSQVGYSLMLVGIGAAVVQGGLARKLIPWLGEPRSLMIGMGIGALAYLGYGLAPEGWMVYVIILVASLGGIAGPAGQAMITKSVPVSVQGEVQGALLGLQSIATVIGAVIGGNVFAYFISEGNPYVPGASFLLGSVFATVGLMLAVMTLRRHGAPGPGQQADGGGVSGATEGSR